MKKKLMPFAPISEYFKAQKQCAGDGAALTMPVLIVQGSDDSIVATDAVHAFYRSLTVDDKACLIYPGMYHEVLNEVDRLSVYRDIVGWLEQHML